MEKIKTNKNYILGLLLIVALIALVVWLGKDASAPALPQNENPAVNDEESEGERGWEELGEVKTAGGAAARVHLAVRLNIDIRDVSVISEVAKEWSDSCLGLGGPAESCALVMVPGYEVVLVAGGGSYTYRTNSTGSVVRAQN